MSDIKNLVCDFDNLYVAMNRCKKGVIWKDSVAGWVKNSIRNCRKLEESLFCGKYKIDSYTVFVIYEPKRRVIVSTRFKDRVFQRSLCDNYLTKEISRHFIYDNGACLKGKGTDFSRKRLCCHMQKFYRKHNNSGYVLKLDLHNYFGSTHHSVAKASMLKRLNSKWAYDEVCRIIDSFNQGETPDVGLGLGSQVTQLIQLAVLDDLDHYIKEKLKIKHYVRYMDDFVLLHEDKSYLRYCYSEIVKKIEKLGLELNAKKSQLFPIKQGIKFLGFRFNIADGGKIIKKILPEKIKKERRKLRKQVQLVKIGKLSRESVDDGFRAWVAHVSGKTAANKKGQPFSLKTDNYFVIKNMKEYYRSLWKKER